MDQIFGLQQIFEKSWEYAKEVNACFVDLKKAHDRIPRDKLWTVLSQYGIGGQLLTTIKSLYMHSEVCVRVYSATTKPFRVSVGLRQVVMYRLIGIGIGNRYNRCFLGYRHRYRIGQKCL